MELLNKIYFFMIIEGNDLIKNQNHQEYKRKVDEIISTHKLNLRKERIDKIKNNIFNQKMGEL